MPRKPKLVEQDEYTKLIYNQMNRQDLLKEYRKVAKRMNQRIVTLEKNGFKMPQGEAKKFLEQQGKTRFQERLTKYAKDKTDAQLRHEIMIMHRFEESKQTTLSGKKETRKKLREALMKKVITEQQSAEYDRLTASKSKKDAQKAEEMRNRIPEDLLDEFLGSINDLKDKMSWEYEKAVEQILELIHSEPNMTTNKLRNLVRLATSTRNEVQYKKLLNNKSTTDYDNFANAFTRTFGNFRVRRQ